MARPRPPSPGRAQPRPAPASGRSGRRARRPARAPRPIPNTAACAASSHALPVDDDRRRGRRRTARRWKRCPRGSILHALSHLCMQFRYVVLSRQPSPARRTRGLRPAGSGLADLTRPAVPGRLTPGRSRAVRLAWRWRGGHGTQRRRHAAVIDGAPPGQQRWRAPDRRPPGSPAGWRGVAVGIGLMLCAPMPEVTFRPCSVGFWLAHASSVPAG